MTFDNIITLTDMKGVPEFLFTLKWEGVTKLFESFRYESPIFLTNINVYDTGMYFGNFIY